MNEPYIVGVTGSLGAGKSALCRLLAERGLAVLDADQTSREVTAPGEAVLAELKREFGADILDRSGRLDRARLAVRALADPAARDRLQAILHPPIRRALAGAVRELGAAGQRIVVIEAAMILEGGQRDFYDLLVVVTAPTALKLARAAGRGMPVAEAERRLALQWSDERKATVADWVVHNDADLAALGVAATKLVTELERRIAASGGG